jgi:hypothetical protein
MPRLTPRFVVCDAKVGIIFELAMLLGDFFSEDECLMVVFSAFWSC